MTKTAVADPPKPDRPCSICGSKKWWLRRGWGKPEWLCGVCCPEPRGENAEKQNRIKSQKVPELL